MTNETGKKDMAKKNSEVLETESGLVAASKLAVKEAMKTGSMDLKESLELLKGLETLVHGIERASEDGEINWKDTPALLLMLKDFNIFLDAAKGMEFIPAELKDLDKNEIQVFAGSLYPILIGIKNIVLNLKGVKLPKTIWKK